jgi:hypothetical protein
MKITRKQFLVTGLAAAGAAAGIGASACGSDDGGGGSGSGGDCESSGASVDITGNHGHTLAVTGAQVTAGAAMVYDIEGSAGHSHDLALSSDDFQKLKAGGSITKQSSNAAGHEHEITVSC